MRVYYDRRSCYAAGGRDYSLLSCRYIYLKGSWENLIFPAALKFCGLAMGKTIHFIPDNVKITVDDGENLLAAAANAGVYVPAYCGGDGVCGRCKVRIKEGEVESDPSHSLKADAHAQGWRLACKSKVITDLVVEMPEEKGQDGKIHKRKPKTTRAISARSLDALIGKWEVDPPVEKRFLRLSPPHH